MTYDLWAIGIWLKEGDPILGIFVSPYGSSTTVFLRLKFLGFDNFNSLLANLNAAILDHGGGYFDTNNNDMIRGLAKTAIFVFPFLLPL